MKEKGSKSELNVKKIDRRLACAPMMDLTDRYCRYFLRLISGHTLLYTEMITTGALLHGDCDWLLRFDPVEHPIALQLGGSDPADLAFCAKLGEAAGYDEINLNLGCPSERVQSGCFGAALMAEPELVTDCIRAMNDAVAIPVTVKQRIGIDHQDSYGELSDFVGCVSESGCSVFIIHARKAWLHGLSPKQNREIPPLQYDLVYRLKRDYPQFEIVINGGVNSLNAVLEQLKLVDGVMIGRAVYHDPWLLAEADRLIFADDHAIPDRYRIVELMLPFIDRELKQGTPISRITRHMLGLYHGQAGARAWRRYISENAHKKGAGSEILIEAAAKVATVSI